MQNKSWLIKINRGDMIHNQLYIKLVDNETKLIKIYLYVASLYEVFTCRQSVFTKRYLF